MNMRTEMLSDPGLGPFHCGGNFRKTGKLCSSPLRAAAGQIPCGRDVELSSLRLGLGTETALRSPHTPCVRGCSPPEHAALSKTKLDPVSWVLLFSGLLSLPVPTKHSAYHPAGSAAKREWISRGGRVMECETPN